MIGIDQDEVALAAATERLGALPDDVRPELDILYGNFGELDSLLVQAEVPSIDAILFDLGVSSVQIDTPSRGFSFKESGPLDMRMDPSNQTLTRQQRSSTLITQQISLGSSDIIQMRNGQVALRSSWLKCAKTLLSQKANSLLRSLRRRFLLRLVEAEGILLNELFKRCA